MQQKKIVVFTIRKIHAVLHRSLEKAVGYGLVLRNPAHGITLPKYKPAEMLVWDESQVLVFLVGAESSRFKSLYHLAVTTGMRQGEIFGLKWSDLHWKLWNDTGSETSTVCTWSGT